eukprot:CAMPEP_0195281604 /NCGR_PEP_ID=MMETSP0707-20130614/847_1 /TAXON_ID=33640 /ORGANISM="Asterionellopsis glacialis, Strain CCMP134" /LENGTH=408 /DNA_ID=CAMNT_0040340509 /DNA_START=131 /DNA_END=1357 /DNA_ORIENTATION=-
MFLSASTNKKFGPNAKPSLESTYAVNDCHQQCRSIRSRVRTIGIPLLFFFVVGIATLGSYPSFDHQNYVGNSNENQTATFCSNANKIEICSHQLLNPPELFVHRLGEKKNPNGYVPAPGSLAAATAFWNFGVRCFDMDVVTLQDGTLLASHPSRLAKSTNGAKAEDFTLQQIRKAGADEESFPLLSDLLGHFSSLITKVQESQAFSFDSSASSSKSNTVPQLHGPLINIDLKGPSLTLEHVNGIANQIYKLRMEQHIVICVTALLEGEKGPGIDLLQVLSNTSADDLNMPNKVVPLGLVLRDRAELDNDTERINLLVKKTYPKSIQALVASFKFDSDWFQRLGDEKSGLGLPIIAWTVDAKSELTHAIDVGVSAVVSNTPVQLQTTLDGMRKQCHASYPNNMKDIGIR